MIEKIKCTYCDAIYLGISVKHASMIKQNKSLFRKQYKICDYVEMDKTIE